MLLALVLIAPLAIYYIADYVINDKVEDEATRIAENNGLAEFDSNAPSIFDDHELNLGTNGVDMLRGTSGNDALIALGEADVVRGFNGDDLIEAGTNNDTAFGGAGNDVIGGGTGADVLLGDRGNDVIIGGNGDDSLLGGDGNDTLIGGGDKDTLEGGDGNDLLISGLARFGSGNDVEDLSASAAQALISLGSGLDFENIDFAQLQSDGVFNGTDVRFLSDDAETNPQGSTINGGAGDDLLILNHADRVTGGAGSDTFVLNDRMVGQNMTQLFDYNAAEDVIAVQYDSAAAPTITVQDAGSFGDIYLDGQRIARVTDGAGLDPSTIRLIQSPFATA